MRAQFLIITSFMLATVFSQTFVYNSTWSNYTNCCVPGNITLGWYNITASAVNYIYNGTRDSNNVWCQTNSLFTNSSNGLATGIAVSNGVSQCNGTTNSNTSNTVNESRLVDSVNGYTFDECNGGSSVLVTYTAQLAIPGQGTTCSFVMQRGATKIAVGLLTSVLALFAYAL